MTSKTGMNRFAEFLARVILNNKSAVREKQLKEFGPIGVMPNVAPVITIPKFVKHEIPTIDEKGDWRKVNPILQKPINPKLIENEYEIERLKNEVKFHKDTLVNYQNKVSEYTKDYGMLEVDFRNSETDNRKLCEENERLNGVEYNNLYLMQRVINLSETTAEVKEMGRSAWI